MSDVLAKLASSPTSSSVLIEPRSALSRFSCWPEIQLRSGLQIRVGTARPTSIDHNTGHLRFEGALNTFIVAAAEGDEIILYKRDCARFRCDQCEAVRDYVIKQSLSSASTDKISGTGGGTDLHERSESTLGSAVLEPTEAAGQPTAPVCLTGKRQPDTTPARGPEEAGTLNSLTVERMAKAAEAAQKDEEAPGVGRPRSSEASTRCAACIVGAHERCNDDACSCACPSEAKLDLRIGLQEMIEDWESQATADESGWSYRRGSNVFNEGAAFVLRRGVEELKALLADTPRTQEARPDPECPWCQGSGLAYEEKEPCACLDERTVREQELEIALRDLLEVAQGAAFGPCRAFRTAEALLARKSRLETPVSEKGSRDK